MDWVVELISAVRSVRAEMNVPPKSKLALSVKGTNKTDQARLESHRALVSANARLESIVCVDDEYDVSGAIQTVVGSMTLLLPLAGVIDLDQERARLQKENDKHDTEIAKIEKKLNNYGFVSKAPASVVDENKARVAAAQDAKSKVLEALSRLASI
jgi:valyl-tRNA synthetase